MIKKKEAWLSKAIIIVAGVLCFGAGRLSWQYQHHRDLQLFQATSQMSSAIPVVFIEEIEKGRVFGSTNDPSVRIQSGDQVAVPSEDMAFELDVTHLGYLGEKRPKITIEVPEWAQFIASKSGKYYYLLTEKQAKKLSAANHLYFATKEEAEASGKIFRER